MIAFILFSILQFLYLGVVIAKHGKPKDRVNYNMYLTFISSVISHLWLYFMGVYSLLF